MMKNVLMSKHAIYYVYERRMSTGSDAFPFSTP